MGNKAVSEGIAYQCMATTYFMLRMLLYKEYQSITQNNHTYVDDISAKKSEGSIEYYQCKLTGDLSNGGFSTDNLKNILIDFYKQYQLDKIKEEKENTYFLISQSQPKVLSKILKILEREPKPDSSIEAEINSLLSKDARDFFYMMFNELREISELSLESDLEKEYSGSVSLKQKKKEIFLSMDDYIDFLRKIRLRSRDVQALKDDLYSALKESGYPQYAYHIINTTAAYEWLSQNISRSQVQSLLKDFGIQVVGEGEQTPAPRTKSTNESDYILLKADVKFFNKLKHIIALIGNKHINSQGEKKKALKIINQDDSLKWHFFKNLNDPDWFPALKDGLILSIVEDYRDTAVKFQLLEYVRKSFDKWSDEIAPLLVTMEMNTKNPHILSDLVKTLGGIRPQKKKSLDIVWKILSKLSEHQHPWVRREIPGALSQLSRFDYKRVLIILKKLLMFNPARRDVTQGSYTLALTFQGRDNENWVFDEAMKVLNHLLKDRDSASEALKLAVSLEVQSLKSGRERISRDGSFYIDYSYIWLKLEDFEKREHVYERKRRIALEISLAFKIFLFSEPSVANDFFKILSSKRYEVFYLILIQNLSKIPEKYPELTEKFLFDDTLWFIGGLIYPLQKLSEKYFASRDDKIEEFVIFIQKITSKKDQEVKEIVKQAMLVSIPEVKHSQKAKGMLEKLNKKRGREATIQPPFSVSTSWKGPEPDISLDELKQKGVKDLIKIMEDSTSHNRRAEPYDLSGIFSQLVKGKPSLLPAVLESMKSKKIASDFAGHMVKEFIKEHSDKIEAINEIFIKIPIEQTWARMEVARFLREICIKKEIERAESRKLDTIKRMLSELANDPDPEDDDTKMVSSKHPQSGIDRGINSVRGVTAEAIVALTFYFPQDEQLTKLIKKISSDSTNAVKSTLIYNIGSLVRKRYDVCKAVVNKFWKIRDSEIDYSIIYYFSYLDQRKFEANLHHIKSLFTNNDEQIQELLGELIGSRFLGKFKVDDLIDDIMKQSLGEESARKALVFELESNLYKRIALRDYERVLSIIKTALNPETEDSLEVRQRAAFIFERDEIGPKDYVIFENAGIFEVVLKDIRNLQAQSHLISYLEKCITSDKNWKQAIEVLRKQVKEIDAIWSDCIVVKKIASAVDHIFKYHKSEREFSIAEEIFDKGLEYGWQEFYKLFNEYYKNE